MARKPRAAPDPYVVPGTSLLTRKIQAFSEKATRYVMRNPAQDARFNFLVGSVRSAKTWAQHTKILQLNEYPVAGLKLITGQSKEAIYRNVLNDLFEIIEDEMPYSYNRNSGALTLGNTRWQVVGARDESSEKSIRGATVGAVVADEIVLMPENFFKMLISRMSPPGAKLYGSTNPDSPYHWFKKDVLDNPEYTRGLGPGADLWWQTWTMDDNPTLSESYKRMLKRSYSGVFFERFIRGLWVVAQGAIYRDVLVDSVFYTTATRPIALRSPNGHVERWLACDYGTANPFVLIDVLDDGRTVWWDREYYWDSRTEKRQKTDSEYADDLIRFMTGKAPGESDTRSWCGVIVDPSATSFIAELRSRGVYVIEADNNVPDGIRRVMSMLRNGKLKINKEQCPNGVRELSTYAWDEKKHDEQPLKDHDHFPDAGRYHINTRISDYRVAA